MHGRAAEGEERRQFSRDCNGARVYREAHRDASLDAAGNDFLGGEQDSRSGATKGTLYCPGGSTAIDYLLVSGEKVGAATTGSDRRPRPPFRLPDFQKPRGGRRKSVFLPVGRSGLPLLPCAEDLPPFLRIESLPKLLLETIQIVIGPLAMLKAFGLGWQVQNQSSIRGHGNEASKFIANRNSRNSCSACGRW